MFFICDMAALIMEGFTPPIWDIIACICSGLMRRCRAVRGTGGRAGGAAVRGGAARASPACCMRGGARGPCPAPPAPHRPTICSMAISMARGSMLAGQRRRVGAAAQAGRKGAAVRLGEQRLQQQEVRAAWRGLKPDAGDLVRIPGLQNT
jgi:hypothetical protein